MARRPQVDYTAVREMAISEIAELWHEQLGMPIDLLVRELRIAVINLARNWREEGLIDPIPPDDDLPPITTRLRWTHPGKVEASYGVCIASASNLTGLVKANVECRRIGL
jgi:hypothetical protein